MRQGEVHLCRYRTRFGKAPEVIQEVTVAVSALDAMQTIRHRGAGSGHTGARDLRATVALSVPIQIRSGCSSAVTNDAAVKSLGEVLGVALSLCSRSPFRLRNASEGETARTFRRAVIKRTAIRQAVLAVFDGTASPLWYIQPSAARLRE